MKFGWRVRMYREGDEIGYIRLMNLVFAQSTPRNIGLWLWKYKHNPHGFLETVADRNGEIVGHMGLLPVKLKIGKKIVRGAQAVDLAVHPSFRRQGMFLELGKALMGRASEEEISIVYGFPNEPAYYGHLKYDWFFVCRIPVLAKFLSATGLLKFLLIRLYYFITRRCSPVSGRQSTHPLWFLRSMLGWLNMISALNRKKSDKAFSNKTFRICQVYTFDRRADDLWNHFLNEFTFSLERNAKYLNWRYFENPRSHYTVFVVERAGRLEGYIVLSIEKPWNWASLSLNKLGYVVDILVRSRDAAECLIQAAIRYFSREQVDLILCWMTRGHFFYDYLLEKGFRFDKTLQEITLISGINSPLPPDVSLETMKNEQNWFVTIGDSDLI